MYKFGQGFANQIQRRLPAAGDKWHLDEVVLTIAGVKHWLWRVVGQNGMVLDILVQSRRDTQAARRLLCKLMKRQCRAPRVMITDKLASYGAAKRVVMGVGALDRSKVIWPQTPVCYAMTVWRRTGSGRPAASIRLSTATPIAASVCWAAKPRARSRGPISAL